MTELLVKWFVKNPERTEDPKVRTAYGLLSGATGIACNLILFGAKLLTGVLINSISVMADAFNNLSDAASSVIALVGVKMAEKPADEEHPFGHGRMEYIAALVVAFLVIQVGFTLFQTSIKKILHPELIEFRGFSLVILLLSVGMKLWMAAFNRKLGKRIDSKVMLATAADSLGDVWATAAAILSILVAAVWKINIDGLVGLAVSVLVMIAGINIARDTLSPLLGEPIDPALYHKITQFVESYEGILGSHDLIVHNYGPGHNMASIHAEVPNDVDIETSHEIIDRIERDARRKLDLFLVIHMDPVETNDLQVIELREMTCEALKELDNRLNLHDFRVVQGNSRINLIFDLVFPLEYTSEQQETLRRQLCEQVQAKDPRCHCLITMEKNYQMVQ